MYSTSADSPQERLLRVQVGTLERGHAKHAASRVARQLLRVCGQRAGRRFDPLAAAAALGFEVRTVELPSGLGGRLRLYTTPPTIELRASDGAKRRRFTLAHELAHVCFASSGVSFPVERGERGAGDRIARREEWLCNQVAAELLMPAWAFRRVASGLTPGRTGLITIADHFAVSWEAAYRRVEELRVWSVGKVYVDIDGSGVPDMVRPVVMIKGRVRGAQEVSRHTRALVEKLRRIAAEVRSVPFERGISRSDDLDAVWTTTVGSRLRAVVFK